MKNTKEIIKAQAQKNIDIRRKRKKKRRKRCKKGVKFYEVKKLGTIK